MNKERGLWIYLLLFVLVSLLPDNSITKKLREQKDGFLKQAAVQTTTIRIKESTKEKIANLDFVKKDTYDEILARLIEFYEQYRGNK